MHRLRVLKRVDRDSLLAAFANLHCLISLETDLGWFYLFVESLERVDADKQVFKFGGSGFLVKNGVKQESVIVTGILRCTKECFVQMHDDLPSWGNINWSEGL